jgi:hypothetical protein
MGKEQFEDARPAESAAGSQMKSPQNTKFLAFWGLPPGPARHGNMTLLFHSCCHAMNPHESQAACRAPVKITTLK